MKNVFANIAAATLILVPTIASAGSSAPATFTHDGVVYTYTVEQQSNHRVLRGHSGASRTPFVLTLGKSWVDGTVGDSAVSFSLKSVKPVRGIVRVEQMAAR